MLEKERKMKFYSYVIPRDYGFAPNPYFGYCTLADCKPGIRKMAQTGDWVAAFGAAMTPYKGKLVMLMQVEEAMSFDEYWMDERFRCKRPVFSKGLIHAYGDNIYHHVDGEWVQEYSHHSKEDGTVNEVNLNKDTGTDRVLISTKFYYFGDHAITIPDQYAELIRKGRNCKINTNIDLIEKFTTYMDENYKVGIYGTPYSRRDGAFAHYKGDQL